MLLVAANRIGAAVLWSEDLNDGQTYGAVTVRNPFGS
jgi:predicted nucleic acid-binding protein